MTYAEYVEGYTGREAMDEKDFEFFFEKARRILSTLTYGRSDDSELDEVKYAAAEIAQQLFENRGRDGLTGESNDGYSLSFAKDFSLDGAVYRTAKTWLGGTGLMYAGVEQFGDC